MRKECDDEPRSTVAIDGEPQMKPVVFIPERMDSSGIALLRRECQCLVPWEEGSSARGPNQVGTRDAAKSVLSQIDAIIVRLYHVTKADIKMAPRLKVIAKHGTGVDNIDCGAASERGIPVVYTPDANANAVAEYTVALMLAMARQLCEASLAVRADRFSERGQFCGIELDGKTLVVLGLGRIGSLVARKAALGLNMHVFGYDPFLQREDYPGPAILVDSLEELLPKADFLTLHIPLTPATEGLLNEHMLSLMKPGCKIVNTSRGAVIDDGALISAVSDGRIGGAALDVFREEPLPADHPFCAIPQILLTPHISSSTSDALERMSIHAAEEVLDVLHGRRPQHVVNPQVLG